MNREEVGRSTEVSRQRIRKLSFILAMVSFIGSGGGPMVVFSITGQLKAVFVYFFILIGLVISVAVYFIMKKLLPEFIDVK